ncbi:aquaporin [Linepithema humile]|uniref:aquaporin n=1 Tax=Linepithema humile TaxID=83485 RepID=UPI00062379ED|nr:PREDICTED: aquaporin-like [Linepithema humile]XP_012226158.1 PREDICTED: aquaporin-like [Linepithema humile]
MEQNGISIISPPGVTENSVGKSKSVGVTLRFNDSMQMAKEKLKAPWSKKLMVEDGTLYDKFLTALAELIGTAILVFLGCTACVGSMEESPKQLQIAFAFGIAVMISIQCVGHISGAHLNPAITVAAMILGKKSLLMSGFYVVAQCLGALLGYGLLKGITPEHLLHSGTTSTINSFCTTDVNRNLTPGYGVAAEALATGILTFFACGIWDSRNKKNTDSVAIRFGFCVTALCLAFIPYTGCSLNPARTIGPAMWNNYWHNHWIYWLGPIGGAIIAALMYRCLFSPDTKDEEDNINTGTLNGIET